MHINKKLIYTYVILFTFLISGYWLVFRLNSATKEIGFRDYPQASSEGVLRVALINDTILYDVSENINEEIYNFFTKLKSTDSIRFEFYPYSNKINALDDLNANLVDIVAINIPVTTDYMERFAFTIPMETDRLVIVQRNEKNNGQFLNTTFDLDNKIIDVVAYPSFVTRIDNFIEESGANVQVRLHDLNSVTDLVMMVSDSTLNYTVCAEKVANKLKHKYENLDISLPVGFVQERAWAVRKNSVELLDSLNNWIRRSEFCTQKR